MSNHVNSLITEIDVSNPPKRKIFVGHIGETGFRKIVFLVDSWKDEFPTGTPTLVFKRADGKTYPVNLSQNDNGNPVFTPSSTETAFAGDCVIQLRWTQNEVLGKTCNLPASVESAIGSVGPMPDDDVRDYEAEISANTNARHIHSNKNVLDGITAQKVSMWSDKQNKLTAGQNVTISGDTISATVQDGSLTEAKFSDALKLKTIKDYVTPEMFGAKGDGVTDDSDAIISALNSSKGVVFLRAKYAVTKELTGTAKMIIGNNSEIVVLNDLGRIFNLPNAELVTGLKINCNNHGVVICILCQSKKHEISNIEIFDLVDTRTNVGTQMVYSLGADVVSMHDIYVHDCSHIVNGEIADAGGNITCVYAREYTKQCSIYNISIREIHNVDAQGNITMEDGGGIYTVCGNENAGTFIRNVYGYNFCKRLIKTQCVGCVVVNGVNSYSDSEDHLVTIGIQDPMIEGERKYSKGIITNCHLVNAYNGGTVQKQMLIATSENIIISDCYLESPYQFALLNEGNMEVNNCDIVGYGVLNRGRSTIVRNCNHSGNGFLYNPNVGAKIYIEGCHIEKADKGGTIDYPFMTNNVHEMVVVNCFIKNAAIWVDGVASVRDTTFESAPNDCLYIRSGGDLDAFNVSAKADSALLRAFNIATGGNAKFDKIKTENFSFNIVGQGSVSLGAEIDFNKLNNTFSAIENVPQYVDALPTRSYVPDGLYVILKTDGKLYRKTSGSWVAVN